jgi:hypothetical protein
MITIAHNNQRKSKARRDSKTGVKGIAQISSGKYTAVLNKKHLGTFDTIREAMIAWNTEAQRLNDDYDCYYTLQEIPEEQDVSKQVPEPFTPEIPKRSCARVETKQEEYRTYLDDDGILVVVIDEDETIAIPSTIEKAFGQG